MNFFLLCASHALTKFGSKGWEFATPLLLLHFSPDGSLFAPTVFGLSVFAFNQDIKSCKRGVDSIIN